MKGMRQKFQNKNGRPRLIANGRIIFLNTVNRAWRIK